MAPASAFAISADQGIECQPTLKIKDAIVLGTEDTKGVEGDERGFDYSWTVPFMHETPYDDRKLLSRFDSLFSSDFLNYTSLHKDTVLGKGVRAMPIASLIEGRSRYGMNCRIQ